MSDFREIFTELYAMIANPLKTEQGEERENFEKYIWIVGFTKKF